ncbi:outer dense fiber protein 2-like isoform X1 [Brienomyrus brachyistius]|uniref:outer dense fiber protein 2-like isoform X1 n=1 Tax=Brienomyrus brachyistius TaxID=42636 RepID=UPI0020B3692F|nr:outer dense fiber protein 2-like isoform X1 [Brienomyrus brachyistius]
MKARSSSPVHVHVDETAPVRIHVHRSQSLPSSMEMEQLALTSVPDYGSAGTRKKAAITINKDETFHTSREKSTKKSNLPQKPAYKIWAVSQSDDFDLGKAEGEESSSHDVADFGFKGRPSPHDSGTVGGDAALLSGGLDGRGGRRCGSRSYLSRSHLDRHGYDMKDTHLLRTLIDAETAAGAVAVQLVSFKDVLPDGLDDSRFKHSGERHLSREKSLLLEKLEIFKRINWLVREQLRELQNREENRLETSRQIDILLEKLTKTESENRNLKRNLSEVESKVEELTDMRKREMENVGTALQLSKSVDATRAVLQGQLRSKESENNRLCVQLRSLERAMAERKLETETMRAEMTALSEKAAREKEALKKAVRAQKRRAERFESAIEKCYGQMREKDLQLAEANLEARAQKGRFEQVSEEKTQLEAQIAVVMAQVSDLTAELHRERDVARVSSRDLPERMEKIRVENEELGLENAELKVCITGLEEALARSASELDGRNADCQGQKELAERCRVQVDDLQRELETMKAKLEQVHRENEVAREGKEAEHEKVKIQLESRVRELAAYPDLLKAAQQSLQGCEDKLQSSQRKHSDQSEIHRQLQAEVARQSEQLASSLAARTTMSEASTQLQLKADLLQRRVEELQQENTELVCRLANQEEALRYGETEQERRSAECASLSRQLEAALADVRQQVSNVKETATVKERSLQGRILELEVERTRRDGELQQLKRSKQAAETQHEVRLRDLQLSLERSDSHAQRLQDYVDFLKASYAAMFEDSLAANVGGAYLFK